MYYDHIEAARKEAAKKKYEELKNHIHSIDDNTDMVNEWFDAYTHMVGMESKIIEQAKKSKNMKRFLVCCQHYYQNNRQYMM